VTARRAVAAPVEAGAALVRAAADTLPSGLGERAELWRIDVDPLLAERARLAGGTTVELPRHLSVSQLVELERSRRTRTQHPPSTASSARTVGASRHGLPYLA
jgi:hypothetical protein